jgi:pilus assembly protein CpaE
MLTAAIASSDPSSSAQLLASLQQNGLVSTIQQWTVHSDKPHELTGILPDVVLLDLGRDPAPYFALAAQIRKMQPTVHVVACSAVFPPDQYLLMDAMRCGVQDFVAKPVMPDALRDLLNRFQETRPVKRSSERLIVLMGAKGGVGTTTVAVNLGAQLCSFAKKRTVLLDFARPMGNAHLLLDMHPRFGIRDAVENLERLDSHFFAGLLTHHKSNLELLGGALHPEEWQTIPVAPLERVVNVAQSDFDSVLMDLGAQFSSEWGPILQMARMILLVTETNVPSLWNLNRRMQALAGIGVNPERIRVIVNRWHKGDEETLKAIENDNKYSVLTHLPNDYRKAISSFNLGVPLMENHDNLLTNHYRQLASQISGIKVQSEYKRGALSTFFSTKR